MTPPGPGTTIRTHADLAAVWQRLMGTGGFARSTLWLIFVGADDGLQRVIMPIDDLPGEPDERFVGNLVHVLTELHDAGDFASAALLLSRPGPPEMSGADRRWARVLRDALGPLSPWPLHLATRGRVQVFAPDDLIAA
jgi:hypothetical protein